jgi:hypothetical protein
MSARILQFTPLSRGPGYDGEERFEASVDEDGSIRIVIGSAQGQQTWSLTPRQAVELARFLETDWMTRLR